MAYPKNPENIIVQNKYYPKGLTEKDNWEYYQNKKVKEAVLKEVRNRDLMLFIATDVNETVVKRKGITSDYIRVDRKNYDETIHPRVLSIHSTMKKYEDICIVDIDTDNFNLAKQATIDTYTALKNIEIIKDIQIRFTGKTSFHIYCNLYNKLNIDIIRTSLKAYLLRSDISYKYSIGEKRNTNTANIDLSSNKYSGGFITLHSLSVLGLRCMDLSLNQVHSFDPKIAKI